MYKQTEEQSTIQPYFLNYPPINYNPYFSPVYYLPTQLAGQDDFRTKFEEVKLKYQNLLQENQQLKNKIIQLDSSKKTKRIIKRRRQEDIHRQIKCPYHTCSKEYASQVALNLHIKQKHNGGTKKQRERFAKKMIQAMKKRQQLPNDEINLPPGYLQNLKKNLLDHLESDSSMLYSQESS